MKMHSEDKYSNVGNISGTVVSSRLNEGRMGMILDMLAKKYSNPYTASLREYVSNAHDSHVEAGVTRPVEVTLPTSFEPTLIIRDFGVGMSHEDVINIYSGFGFSTKDTTDELIGGFGIGSKSGLAFSDQFSVSSVKDNLKNVFVATRENGGISYKFAFENVPTDEENGVTVSIPVSRVHEFSEDIVSFVLAGWSKNDVIVLNAKSCNENRIPDTWIETEHGFVAPAVFGGKKINSFSFSARTSSSLLLVGPVLYPNPFINDASIVAKMSIGEVEVSSSREHLELTDKNCTVIRERIKVLRQDAEKIFEEMVEKCDSSREAIALRYSSFGNQIYGTHYQPKEKTFLFNGAEIPDLFPVGADGSETYIPTVAITENKRTSSVSGVSVDRNSYLSSHLLGDVANGVEVVFIRLDNNNDWAKVRTGIHSIARAIKENREVPNKEKFSWIGAQNPVYRDTLIVYGTEFNDFFDFIKVVDASEIVKTGKAVAVKRTRPSAEGGAVKPPVASTIGGRSVSVVDTVTHNVLNRGNSFRKSVTMDELKASGRKVVFFADSKDHKLENVNFDKFARSLNYILGDDAPIFAGVPRTVRNTKNYTDYIEGSEFVRTGEYIPGIMQAHFKKIDKETNSVASVFMSSVNAVRFVYEIFTQKDVVIEINEEHRDFMEKMKPFFLVNSLPACYEVITGDFYDSRTSSKDPFFTLAGMGVYVGFRVTDEQIAALSEYFNNEMSKIVEAAKSTKKSKAKESAVNFVQHKTMFA